ncbi:hypothetical protein [Spirosoma luteum]|uniref:hypothetical protein n=1 Tax=Spirosoma luteum TaxID=431553 RepID=UPI0003704AE7|nr:hypothetical protein [Spirosoma luteum]
MKRLLLSLMVFPLAIGLVDSSFYEAFAVAFSVYMFLTFVHRIGHKITLPECISSIAAGEILFVPAITYWFVPASMPLESNTYFSYALPACLAFCAGLLGVANQPNTLSLSHKQYLLRAADYLKQRPGASKALFSIGLIGFLLKMSVPTLPAFLGTLPAYCLLTSVFYGYYARSTFWKGQGICVIGLLLLHTVTTGTFNDLFFWLLAGMLVLSTTLPAPPTLRIKVVTLCLSFTFLLLVQSVKREYRYQTWGYTKNERTADAGLMVTLLADRVSHPKKLLNVFHLYTAFVRFNQGIIIGNAMNKVPVHEAYAKGEVLLSLVYPFIPRFVWPGKPQTGGYENIRRFTTLPHFANTSINLSPVGEGYVNFGYGGILFALGYGLLLGGFFRVAFQLATRIPSVVLWLPMVYMGCLTMETDLFSTWGSLVNSVFFITFLFWLLEQTGIEL